MDLEILKSPVVAAVVAAVVSGISGYLVSRAGRKHSAVLDRQAQEHRTSLEKQVQTDLKTHDASLRLEVERQLVQGRGEIERSLKSHEARLRVAAESRRWFTERMLTDVGEYRAKLNTAAAKMHEFAQEAWLNGASQDARKLHRECNDALRACPSAGPFVPPEILQPGGEITNNFHDIITEIAEWSGKDKSAREVGCRKSSAALQAEAPRMQKLFAEWFRAEISKHEEILSALEQGTTMPAATALPSTQTPHVLPEHRDRQGSFRTRPD